MGKTPNSFLPDSRRQNEKMSSISSYVRKDNDAIANVQGTLINPGPERGGIFSRIVADPTTAFTTVGASARDGLQP